MKAITLFQPWATLLVTGAKLHETRSWRPRDVPAPPVAVHASKRWDQALLEITNSEPFRTYLQDAPGVIADKFGQLWLPVGGIVGAVEFGAAVTTEAKSQEIDDVERAFGDWRGGRFAWPVRRSIALPDLLQCRGAQGLWTLRSTLAERVRRAIDVAVPPDG